MTDDDAIVRTMRVPAWMVWGATALIVILSGGPIGQLLINSRSIWEMSVKQADMRAEISSIQVRQQALEDSYNTVNKSLVEIDRKLAVISSRMP